MDTISRQQAIDVLGKMQTYKLFAGDDMLLIDQAEAQTELMMLPSAQPETNCSEIPNNSDTISRQQAVDFVGSMNMCDEISNEAYEKLTSYLDELPSAEPERKTGHWIYGESEVGNDGYYCSECGNFVPWIYEESAMNFIREYKFCPNCGADMRGEG